MATPADPQIQLMRQIPVFSQYGQTMLAVQLFESQLAMAAQIASVNPDRRITSPKQLRRQINHWLDSSFHWYWRASPSESRNQALSVIAEELHPAVDNAIKWRNRLAHRYLREKLAAGVDGAFPPGTIDELAELAKGFEKLGRRLLADHQELMESWPDESPPPKPVAEAMERAIHDVLRGGTSE